MHRSGGTEQNRSAIVIGVNHASSGILEEFISTWLDVAAVKALVIVDNFSTAQEVDRVRAIAASYEQVSVLYRTNDGYGAGLNAGIQFALDNLVCDGAVFLFGNLDVTPIAVRLGGVDDCHVPAIRIFQNGTPRRVFLSRVQRRCLSLARMAARSGNPAYLSVYRLFIFLLRPVPSRIWAVHGAFFVLDERIMRLIHPIFDPRAFLYCEEMFFARKVESLGLSYRAAEIDVAHRGSFSISQTGHGSGRKWFETWRQSAMIYFEAA